MNALREPTFAWEPLTPRGVAAFARASFERLFIVQSVFALIAAAAVVWLLSDGIFPVINDAIEQLPDSGSIHGGRLDWRDDSPVMLAEGKILALSVDVEHGGTLRSPADFQLEFGRDDLRIYSLFGEAYVPYPDDYLIAANRGDARPAWDAWAPDLLGLAAIGTFFGLLIVWAVLATIYCLPVWLLCFFANRDLNIFASWRLAAAALMPGARCSRSRWRFTNAMASISCSFASRSGCTSSSAGFISSSARSFSTAPCRRRRKIPS